MGATQVLMMPPSSNLSFGGAEQGKQCIVNDQMGPFTVLYILIFIISLPGSLLSGWAFICSPRTEVRLDRIRCSRVGEIGGRMRY